jgi:threonyl-tRNA synthetase
VSDAFSDYAVDVRRQLFDRGLRVEADLSSETMRYKIRQAQTQQVPYMLVVGQREQDEGAVAVRHRRLGDVGSMPLAAFVERIEREIAEKTLDPQTAE